MPLKIRPNAIEQEEGNFIFPSVISREGQRDLRLVVEGGDGGVTGSSQITALDTSSGFKTPISVHGSVLQFKANDGSVGLQLIEAGGAGRFMINPTAKNYDLEYLADDGTMLLFGDASIGRVGIGGDDAFTNEYNILSIKGKPFVDSLGFENPHALLVNHGHPTGAFFGSDLTLGLDNGAFYFDRSLNVKYSPETGSFSMADPNRRGLVFEMSASQYDYGFIFSMVSGTASAPAFRTLLQINQDGADFNPGLLARDFTVWTSPNFFDPSLKVRGGDGIVEINTWLELVEIDPPPAGGQPGSGYGAVFVKTDGKLYYKNDGGYEWDLTVTGSASGVEYWAKTGSYIYPAVDDFVVVGDNVPLGAAKLSIIDDIDYSGGGWKDNVQMIMRGGPTKDNSVGLYAVETEAGVTRFGGLTFNMEFDPNTATWVRPAVEFQGAEITSFQNLSGINLSAYVYAHDDSFPQFFDMVVPSGTADQKFIRFNPGDLDMDFSVKSDIGEGLFLQGSNGYVGIGTEDPTHSLTVLGQLGDGFTQRNTRVTATDAAAGAAFDLVLRTTGSSISQGHGPGFLLSIESSTVGPNYIAGVYGTRTDGDTSGRLGLFTRNPAATPAWGPRIFIDHEGMVFNDDAVLSTTGSSFSIEAAQGLGVGRDSGVPTITLGDFITGSAAWPAEPSAGDWIIFGQDAPAGNGLIPYARHNGSGPWGYPQPIISRGPQDYRVTDSWHLFGPLYYIAGNITASTTTTGAPAINNIWCIPLWVNQRFVVTSIGFYVTAGGTAGSKARVGIYDNEAQSDARPRRLILDGGEKTTTTTGLKETTGLSVELMPGQLYWAVFHPGTAAPTIRCLQPRSVYPFFGRNPASGYARVGAYQAVAYAALPAVFSVNGNFQGSSPIPAIYMTFN